MGDRRWHRCVWPSECVVTQWGSPPQRSSAAAGIDWTRITRVIAVASFASVVLTMLTSVVLDGTTGVDFGVFQLGGEIAGGGDWSSLYDGDTFSERFQEELFPGLAEDGTLNTFISTPTFALAMQPLHWLPFSPALLLWSLLSVCFAIISVRSLGLRYPWAVALLLSPAMIVNLAIGQSAALFLALAVVVHLSVRLEWSFRAGLALGLLFVLKPPLAVGYGLWWLVSPTRSRRRVAGAIAGVVVGLAPTLASGGAAWAAFADAMRSRVAIESSWQLNGLSLPEAIKLLNPQSATWVTLGSWGLSLVVGALLILAAKRRWPGDDELLSAAAIVVTVLVSPHLAVYDTALLIIPLAVAHDRGLATERIWLLAAIHGATLAFGRVLFDAQFDVIGRGLSVEFIGFVASILLVLRWEVDEVGRSLLEVPALEVESLPEAA
jgi:hypothetical protein